MDPVSRGRPFPGTLLVSWGAGVLLALALALVASTPGDLGVTVSGAGQPPRVISVVPDSAAWIAGVRPGASVVGRAPSSSTAPGRVTLRAGGRMITLDPRALTPTLGDWGAAGLGLGMLLFGLLILVKSPRQRAAVAYGRMSVVASVALGLVPAGVHGVGWALVLDSIALKLFGPAVLDLVLVFLPAPLSRSSHWRWWRTGRGRILLWLPALALAVLSPVAWLRPDPLFSLLAVAGACALAAYLLAACARVVSVLRWPRPAALDVQLRLVGLALLGGLTPFVALSLVPLALFRRVLVSADLTILALALLPIGVGIAILRGEFLGVTSLIHRRALRLVLQGVLLAAIVATAGSAAALAQQQWPLAVPAIVGVLSAGLALGFAPLLGWLTRQCEHLLMCDVYETAGALLGISAELAQAPPQEIGPLVVNRLTTVLDLSMAVLLTGDQEWACSHPRSAIPDQFRTDVLRHGRTILTGVAGAEAVVERVRRVPVVFLRVGGAAGAQAVLCLGPKRSGDRYTTQDRALLGVLGRHLSILFSNHRLRDQLDDQIAALRAAATERLALREETRGAAERERRRLAGTLHDEAIQLGEEIIRTLGDLLTAPWAPAHAQATITTAAFLSEDLVGRLRQVATALYPPSLETAGLTAALQSLPRDYTWDADCAYTLHVDPRIEQRRLPRDVQLALYTIAREAVGNAVRHGHATSVSVALIGEDERLRLTVRDDGCGFVPRPDSALLASGHLGLILLQERARDLGGTSTITTEPGQGTTIDAQVPAPSMCRSAREASA